MARVSKKRNAYTSQEETLRGPAKGDIYKTALYARLSVEDGGKDGDTLEGQIQYLKNYIENKPQFEFLGVFADNGFTGTNYNRPEFKRILQLVQEGKINCIIVKDLSRLGRNYIETGDFLQKICPLLNIRFISINDNYDTLFPDSNKDISVSLLNIANDLYAKNTSKAVCTALQGKMERGEYIGNYAPYGYLKDPADKNHLIPDPATAPFIKKIYTLRADGLGIGKIAALLNDEDIPSPGRYRFEQGIITNNNKKGTGLLWNRHVLTDILHNVVYIGHLAQAKCRTSLHKGIPMHWTKSDEWVISYNTHEPILEAELFEQVQEINNKRSEQFKENYGKYAYLPKVENPYGKKMVCADCGSVIKLVRSISTKKDKAYFTFKCPAHIEHGERQCTDKSISQDELNRAVLETIKTHIELFAQCEKIIPELQRKYKNSSQKNINKDAIRDIEKKISKLETIRTGLYMDMKDGLLTREEYLYSKNEYTKQIEELTARIDKLSSKKMEESPEEKYSHWIHLVKKFKKVNKVTQELVDAFVDKIYLHEEKRIDIQLKYMDELHSIMEEYQRQEVA